MSIASHLAELQRKHAEHDGLLSKLLLCPSADSLELGELKRRKLALKDRMEALRNRLSDAVPAE